MLYICCMDNYETYNEDARIREEIIRHRKRSLRRRRLISASIALALTILGAHALGTKLGNSSYSSYNKEPVDMFADIPMVNAAKSAIGNHGGGPYWSWYGFDDRVEWCACFVSWAANECGALDADTAPEFAYVPDGTNWFYARDLWLEPGQTPSAGDYIFFDWDEDGGHDHVGIVTSVIDDKIFTVEGNSSDRCRVKCYNIGDTVICGYGHVEQMQTAS